MRNKPTSSKRPSHSVFIVESDGESSYWTKIGSAWAHEDREGFNVSLIAYPVDGRMVIRKPKPKHQEGQGE
jgi:hypothetical protein